MFTQKKKYMSLSVMLPDIVLFKNTKKQHHINLKTGTNSQTMRIACHISQFVFKLLKYPNYILDLFPVLRKLCLSAFEQHLLCGPQPCQVNKALINY